MNRFVTSLIAMLAFMCCASMVLADEEAEVKATVIEFYSSLNAGDFEKIKPFLLPTGFTEFSSRGGLLIDVSLEALDTLFQTGLTVNVSIQHVDVKILGDAAYATFYRVGTLDRGGSNKPQRDAARVTSIWVKQDQRWYLSHVHNSNLSVRKHHSGRGRPDVNRS